MEMISERGDRWRGTERGDKMERESDRGERERDRGDKMERGIKKG